jgi:AraC-like DNA-binding protein
MPPDVDLRNLLGRFPLICTSNIDELQAARQRLYDGSAVELPSGSKGFLARINHYRSEAVGIWYARYGASIEISNQQMPVFGQGFPITGGGEASIDGTAFATTVHGGCVLSPGQSSKLRYSFDFEHIALGIDPNSLRRKMETLVGAPTKNELRFERRASFKNPATQSLRRLVLFFATELGSAASNIPPLALAEFEQSLMVSFLCGNPNSHSHLLEGRPKSAAPWQVRRAEEYIEGNWDQPITMEALAVVTNASARTIFHSFKESRGYSPMAFVKQVRLRHSREMLNQPSLETSVTDVAFACGFGNLGHFAKDYFECFGEHPSQTLKSGKGTSHRELKPR